MDKFYSTKRVVARPWARDGAPGMALHYADGYASWCPQATFERDYQPIDAMSFGHAIHALKDGCRVARVGWDSLILGPGMFIVLMPALYLPPFSTQDTARKVNDRTAKWIGTEAPLDCQPYLALHTANGQWQPGWIPSQADILADDWMILPELDAQ